MRALLALLVAFAHIWLLFIRDYAPTGSNMVQALYGLAGFAHSAVVMFFVLSGYWITRSVVRRAEGDWSWGGYMADRLGRLLPVLIPALLLGGLLDWLSLNLLHSPTHLGLTGSWVLHKDVAADLSPLTLLGNLMFLEGILVHSFGTNGPLWSLAAEFWFYLWFPALYLLVRNRRLSWALPSLLLVLLTPQLAYYFAQWLCGAALVFVEARYRPRAGYGALLGAAAALLGALALVRTTSLPGEDMLLALSFAVFLLAILAVRPVVIPGMRGIARFGANASFSLYVTHFPVIAFVAALTIGRERLVPSTASVALVLATLLATIVVARLFAAMTEAHTSRVRGWLRTPLRATPTATLAAER